MPSQVRAPTVFLLFGANCTGKSEIGRALAAELDRCAFIEMDELLNMVVRGLVGWSRGASPLEHPAEYSRQCVLGQRNAVALCREFAKDGFNSVVEGLGDECRPDTSWIRDSFESLRVRTAALVCDDEVLSARLVSRGWKHDGFLRAAIDHSEWCRKNAELFDCLLDTTSTDPAAAARRLCEVLAP